MKDKKSEEKSLPIGWIVFIVIVLFGVMDDGGAFSVFALLIIAAIVIVAVFVAAKKKKGRDSDGKAKGVITDEQSHAELDKCGEQDHVDIEPSVYLTEDEKRLKQLKSMLKNGIIERDEYMLLIKKFGL